MTVLRDDLRHLFMLRPSPVRWPIGLQAGIAVGAPVLVFSLLGLESLGVMASMGAFVALYGAAMSRVRRAAVLPFVVLGLSASAAVGASTSWSLPLGLLGLFVVTAVAAVLCLGTRIGPPGPVFFALIAGVSGYLTAPAGIGGVGRDPVTVVGMVAVGSMFAYLVQIAPLAVPGYRSKDLARYREEAPHSRPRFLLNDESIAIAARVIIVAGIAVLVSAPLGIDRAYWVVVAGVAVVQNVVHLRLTALRAAHRVLGTLVGVAVYALVAFAEPRGALLALVLAALQFSVELLVTRNYGLALTLITPLALIISTYGAGTDVGAIVRERALDTVLGAGIAVAVILVAVARRRIRSRRHPEPPDAADLPGD